jgi:hypothetical protein
MFSQVAASVCAADEPTAGAEPLVDWTHFGCGAVEPLLPGQQAFCVSVHNLIPAGIYVCGFRNFRSCVSQVVRSQLALKIVQDAASPPAEVQFDIRFCSFHASSGVSHCHLRRDKPLTVSPATATAAFQALPQRQGQPTKYKNSTLLGFLQENFGPPGRCMHVMVSCMQGCGRCHAAHGPYMTVWCQAYEIYDPDQEGTCIHVLCVQ